MTIHEIRWKSPEESRAAGAGRKTPARPAEESGATPNSPPALVSMLKRGIGVMTSQPRNMPEQEHSIKVRSNELYVEDTPVAPAAGHQAVPGLPAQTPAQPLTAGLKAIFWTLGIIVALLFLAALWRVSHRHVPKRTTGKTGAEAVGMPDPGRDRVKLADLSPGVVARGDPDQALAAGRESACRTPLVMGGRTWQNEQEKNRGSNPDEGRLSFAPMSGAAMLSVTPIAPVFLQGPLRR